MVDNFAVHRVVMEEELMEIFVDYKDRFTQILKTCISRIKKLFRRIKCDPASGFRTEINLEATEWIKDIAKAIDKGFVLTIHYGYPAFEYCQHHPSRNNGTLNCYNKHKINNEPYSFIGEQNITAHVNFTALSKWGNKYDLETYGFTNQSNFLMSLGLTNHLRELEQAGNTFSENEKVLLIKAILDGYGERNSRYCCKGKGVNRPFLPAFRLSKQL